MVGTVIVSHSQVGGQHCGVYKMNGSGSAYPCSGGRHGWNTQDEL